MIPILGTLAKIIPLKKVGEALLKAAGIGNGKATDAGIVTLAVGIAGAQATGTDPFESAKIIVDLAQQAWPHLIILFGALLTLVGFFRKAGKATPK